MKGVKSNISLEEFDKIIPHDGISKKMIRLERRVLVESIERSRYDLVRYLVELRGNTILSASDTDSTIMSAAVKQNDVEIVRYLNTCLKLDFSRRDSRNKSLPVHIATERGIYSYDHSLFPLNIHHQHIDDSGSIEVFDYILQNSTNENMIFERNGANLTPMEIAARSSRLIDMFKHIVDLVKSMNILKQFPMSDDETKRFLLSRSALIDLVQFNRSEMLSYILENFMLYKSEDGNTFSTALPLELEVVLQYAMISDCVETVKVLLRFMPPSNVKKVSLGHIESVQDPRHFVRCDRVLRLLIPYFADVIFQDKWQPIIFSAQQQSRFLQRIYVAMKQPDAYSQFGCICNNTTNTFHISSLSFNRMRMFSSSEIEFLRTVYLCANHNPRLVALRLDKRLLMCLTFWGIYMYL